MEDYQKKFLELSLNAKVLEFGDFTLKSGRKSPYFFNAARMLNGGYLYELAECYKHAMGWTYDDLLSQFDEHLALLLGSFGSQGPGSQAPKAIHLKANRKGSPQAIPRQVAAHSNCFAIALSTSITNGPSLRTVASANSPSASSITRSPSIAKIPGP